MASQELLHARADPPAQLLRQVSPGVDVNVAVTSARNDGDEDDALQRGELRAMLLNHTNQKMMPNTDHFN